jgi:hypothetical protein
MEKLASTQVGDIKIAKAYEFFHGAASALIEQIAFGNGYIEISLASSRELMPVWRFLPCPALRDAFSDIRRRKYD